MRRLIDNVFAIGFVAVLGVGMYFWLRTEPLDVAHAIEVPVSTVAALYEENAVRANELYKGKVLRVAGLVWNVAVEEDGEDTKATIMLAAPDSRPVACRVAKAKQRQVVRSLRHGEPIRVVGKMLGIKDGMPTLARCQIEHVGRAVFEPDKVHSDNPR